MKASERRHLNKLRNRKRSPLTKHERLKCELMDIHGYKYPGKIAMHPIIPTRTVHINKRETVAIIAGIGQSKKRMKVKRNVRKEVPTNGWLRAHRTKFNQKQLA